MNATLQDQCDTQLILAGGHLRRGAYLLAIDALDEARHLVARVARVASREGPVFLERIKDAEQAVRIAILEEPSVKLVALRADLERAQQTFSRRATTPFYRRYWLTIVRKALSARIIRNRVSG